MGSSKKLMDGILDSRIAHANPKELHLEIAKDSSAVESQL